MLRGRWRRDSDAIDLREAEIDPSSLEVLELGPDGSAVRVTRESRESRASLASPREAPYARSANDPGSLRGLWEAVSGLDS